MSEQCLGENYVSIVTIKMSSRTIFEVFFINIKHQQMF